MTNTNKSIRSRIAALFLSIGLVHSPAQTGDNSGNDRETSVQATEVPVQLSPFEVSESNNVGYGATDTSSTSRVAQAYIDVPQTVSVVTSEYIKDLSIQDTRYLFLAVPNVVINNPSNSLLTVRASQVGATYVDGISQIVTQQAMPLQFYDRVEVVKGPSSAGFGVGEPGGIVNYVSKTPQGIERTDVSFGVGDYQNYKFALDTQGVAHNNSKLSYRLNTFWDDGNYIKPVWHHQGAGAQLSLKYDLDPATTVQLITAYSDTTTPGLSDVENVWENKTVYTVWRTLTGDDYPSFPNTPKNPGNSVQDWAGGASILKPTDAIVADGWQGLTNKVFTLEAIVDHAFNEHIHVRNAFLDSHTNYTQDLQEINGLDSNPPGYPPGLYAPEDAVRIVQPESGIVESFDLLSDYQFSGIDFKTLIGGVYSQNDLDNEAFLRASVNADGSPRLLNVYDPDRTPFSDPITGRYYYQSYTAKNFGFGWYVQEDASIFDDHIVLSAGWREDYQHAYLHNFLDGSTQSPGWVNNKGVPRYSVTLKPVKWLSFYGLYSQHSDPSRFAATYFVAQGVPSAATKAKYNNFQDFEFFNPGGKLVEGGMKGLFLDGKLTASFAYFHQIETGSVSGRVQEQILNADGTVTQIGHNLISGVNAHGYEWQIFGQPTKRLTFVVGYGQTKGHYPDFADGRPHWWTNPPSLAGHGKYDFGNLNGSGFYATFGAQYFWGFWEYQDPYTWFNAGQYTVDGGIGYKWAHGRQSLYFNMNNFTKQTVIAGNEETFPWTTLPREQAFLTYSLSF